MRLVEEGKFREDLYYRLNVVQDRSAAPARSLRGHPAAGHAFQPEIRRAGQAPCQISPEAMELLLEYTWPGNVRQLENAIERAVVTARDGVIRPENLPTDVTKPHPKRAKLAIDIARPLPEQLTELNANFEKRYLRRALKKCGGHIGRCAKICGLSRRSVTYKLAQYDIDPSLYKRS